MQDKMLDEFNQQTRRFFEPMRKLNSLMLGNMEKMTEYQLEAMKRYSQMGTERMRSASEISDAQDLQAFGAQQAEMMNELSRQMMEDAQALGEMSQQFRTELEQLFGEVSQELSDQAKQAQQGGASAKPTAANKSDAPAKASSQTSRKS
ncbi:phasin family protein [Halomonas sp. LR3S48]|uniref:phasin family protein n=1 Tax=Halomonadaceae TaxID=28256 RepID=UPI0021E4FD74|nr:phasin family protein [Halomonas sp. LR3S48]UYG02478.1 phasin family protein [Halomonas sp. LR3S48]